MYIVLVKNPKSCIFRKGWLKLCLLGIDLGGTSIKAGLVDINGKILKKGQVLTGAGEGTTAVLKRIKNLARDLAGEQGLALGELEGIGIGIPGSVDVARGWSTWLPISSGAISPSGMNWQPYWIYLWLLKMTPTLPPWGRCGREPAGDIPPSSW